MGKIAYEIGRRVVPNPMMGRELIAVIGQYGNRSATPRSADGKASLIRVVRIVLSKNSQLVHAKV